MAKRRAPLMKVSAENVRDLFADEPDAKVDQATKNGVEKPRRKTRNQLEQVIDPNAALVAVYNRKMRQARGLSQRDVEILVWEYGNRTPEEKSIMLKAIEMSPQEMGRLFQIARQIPELPMGDPVLIYCARNAVEAAERLEETRALAIDDLRHSALWTRAVTCLGTKGISTLGDLADADPEELLGIANYGKQQLVLCADVLEQYGLITPRWAIHIKTTRGS